MLFRSRGEHEIYLALSGLFPDTIEPIRHTFEGLLPQENIRVWYAPCPLAEVHPGNQTRREVAELLREAFLASLQPDVIHICSLFEGYFDNAVTSIGCFDDYTPVSVSLYDLIPLLSPDSYLKPNPPYAAFYRRKLEYLKRADSFLAISEFTKQEGIEHLGMPEDRFVNVSTAIEAHFQPLAISEAVSTQLLQKFGITRPFIFYTGGSDQRKNLPRLIQAYAALPAELRACYQMVLAGRMDELMVAGIRQTAKVAGLTPCELNFIGYVAEDELVQLYNLCELFVFPSWHEGFGLPALEAMACGAPVIAAKTTSLPEVIGLEAALFDPMDVAEIAAKIEQSLGDKAFRVALREHGLQQAKRFSWDECAKSAIVALEQAAATRCTKAVEVNVPLQNKLLESIACLECAGRLTEVDLVQIADCVANNLRPGKCNRLFLDVSVIVHGDAKSGIQRVVRSLLRELLENPPQGMDVRPIYFDGFHYRYATKFSASFIGSPVRDEVDEITDFSQDDIYLALDLNAHLTAAVHDLHMQLRQRGIRLYFIVYDILLVQHPEWWPAGTSVIFENWLKSISQVSTGLICISEAVAEEVREWLGQNPPQRLSRPLVRSFHLGADIDSSMPSKGMPADAEMVLGSLSARPSFLMVGTVEPRKGHSQTLDAFEKLWLASVDVNLVIVGKQGWLVDELVSKLRQHPELNRRMFWLEGITDEYLEKIYAASTCLIAASEGEGFGLPLIEAAQHAKPIIARDMPVFREVAGEHAFYFSGRAPENLSVAIANWLSLNQADEHPASQGMPYLSWRESALQLKDQLNLDTIDIFKKNKASPPSNAVEESCFSYLQVTPNITAGYL